jgi:predicted O-linked N-acetylglucosamine transferase (SPINDLY family)
MDPQTSFNLAIEHQRAGRLREAEALYRQILATQPSRPDVLYQLGLLANQAGQRDHAVELIRKAIELSPAEAAYYCDLGVILAAANKLDDAVAAYRQAITLRPQWGLPHNNLGMALTMRGDAPQALECFTRAATLQADCAVFHFNLGNALLRLGNFEPSAAAFGRAVALNQQFAEAFSNQGNALFRLGRLEEAAAACRQAIALQPNYADAHNNLGNVLLQLGRLEEAVSAFQKVLSLHPQFAPGYVNLANALCGLARFDEAIAAYRHALTLRPNWPEVLHNLSNALRSIGDLPAAAAAAREALKQRPDDPLALKSLAQTLYAQGEMDQAEETLRHLLTGQPRDAEAHNNLANLLRSMGRIGEAISSYDQACANEPSNATFASNRLFALQFDPDCESAALLVEHRKWDERFAAPLQSRWPSHPNERTSDRRLRIGYVSPDFRVHCQSLFTEALLSHHDHEKFEIFCFSSTSRPDAVTARLRGHADHWRHTAAMNDEALADLIRADRIDILVDLTMHMAHSRPLLFARKPAPMQIAWLAYPGTTGLRAMDYRLTDPYLDPLGTGETSYSEQSIRLPDTFWCYDPWGIEEDRSPAAQPLPDPGELPALQNGFVTFGCLNDFSKINRGVLELWSRVLRQSERSRLRLLAPEGSVRQWVLEQLARLGITDRVDFVKRQPRRAYLREFQQIDLCLDTLPYNGHTTSLDSFWMGVPVITRVGNTVVGRAGLSQLSNLDLSELAAHNDEQFVSIASEWAGDLAKLAELRSSLRGRMERSPLMDAAKFARNIENTFQDIWGKWVDQHAIDESSAATPMIAKQPDLGGLLVNLLKSANDHRDAGRLAEAQRIYQQILVHDPTNPAALNNLGAIFMSQRHFDQAIGCFRKIVAAHPEMAQGHVNLGNALGMAGRLTEATASISRALELAPDWPPALVNLANVVEQTGEVDQARELLERALAQKPNDTDALVALGNVFKRCGQVSQALEYYGAAAQADPGNAGARHNRLYCLYFDPHRDSRKILEELRDWGSQFSQPLAKLARPHENPRDPNRKLKVGYVCADFRDHVVGRNLLPLLREHDRGQVEVFCYSNVANPDGFTQLIQAQADHWRDVRALNDQQAAELIRADAIDVLVDCTLHMAGCRLGVFARRPAPLQVTFAGYPGGTGLEAIGWRLTDPYLDPPGKFDGDYVERSYRLADSFWCYDAAAMQWQAGAGVLPAPPVEPLPAQRNGYVTFGCLNNFCKVNDGILELWCKVLNALPTARMSLLAPGGSPRQRVLDKVAALGVAPGRIGFVDFQPRQLYLAQFAQIDLALDTLPYNGHTSSLDSFWMGVPVITRVGETVVGRAGYSQLCNLGLPELAAQDDEQFLKIAVEWAGNLSKLGELRGTLRDRIERSPLMDAAKFARNIEKAFREMWTQWALNGNDRKSSPSAPVRPENLQTVAQLLNSAQQHRDSGRQSEAQKLYEQVLDRDPNNTAALNNLGIILAGRRQFEEAITYFRRIVDANPQQAQGQLNLGNALAEVGKLEEAKACMSRALELMPNWLPALVNLGHLLQQSGEIDRALELLERAVAQNPKQANALVSLGNVHKDAARLTAAIECYERAVQVRPDFAAADSNRIFALGLHPDYTAEAIFQQQRLWDRRHAAPLAKLRKPHDNDKEPDRRLRIGYVSADFRDHAVGRNILPLIREHDREQFEVMLYSNVDKSDGMTQLFRAGCDAWRDVGILDDQRCADLIRRDRIDILVDLSLHSRGNRLLVFARKPAPVQVCFAGYPGGTGMETMDWRLTDPYLDPVGQFDAFHVERAHRLADSFWCYDRAAMEWDADGGAPPTVTDLPAAHNGFITFGCLNNFCKVNDAVLELWGQVLRNVASSRMSLMVPPGECRDRVLTKLGERGVAAERISFVTYQPRQKYLAEFGRIDLGLDTFPYNGHTASLDAMWMGVPVITRIGKTVVGRAGFSQLCNLGLPELAAQDDGQFVAIATDWAGDLPRLAQLRRTLRARMSASPLADASRFARNIESAYRQMWRTWCGGADPVV